MTTYAFVMTAILFFVLGIITVSAYEAWLDGREIAKRRRKAERDRKIQAAWQAEVDAGNDDDMGKAVKLVGDELGGTPILDYGKTV